MKYRPRADRTEPKLTVPKQSRRNQEPVLSTRDNLIALVVALSAVGGVSFVLSKAFWYFF
jgi:hypothetical protein